MIIDENISKENNLLTNQTYIQIMLPIYQIVKNQLSSVIGNRIHYQINYVKNFKEFGINGMPNPNFTSITSLIRNIIRSVQENK